MSDAHHYRRLEEKEYPSLLRETANAPQCLYTRGALPVSEHYIAIVGTRKATDYGKEIARLFAKSFAEAGCAVVSGLALGIDAAAHRGALEGNGATVAVLGNGIDTVYPSSHTSLASAILENGGALVSEYAPGTPTYPSNFLARNRIISGLSLAVVVIEAPQRSGALATARFAAEQNRDVFVIPGNIKSGAYEGSHALIRDGAILATSPEEVLEDLSITPRAAHNNVSLSDDEQLVLSAIERAGKAVTIDELIECTKLTAARVTQAGTMLALYGKAREENGKYTI